MALIKCSECGKQVSDTATVCMGCGAPVGDSGVVGNTAFEKRIEEYQANGYNLFKREGDSAKMIKKSYATVVIIVTIVFFIIGAIWSFASAWDRGYGGAFAMLPMVFMVAMSIIIIFSIRNSFLAIITITKTGKIEETGVILKR